MLKYTWILDIFLVYWKLRHKLDAQFLWKISMKLKTMEKERNWTLPLANDTILKPDITDKLFSLASEF